jgi:hypothetical protein
VTFAWPPPDPSRLADALASLADVDDRELRSQLAALTSLMRNLGRHDALAEERDRRTADLEDALIAGDEGSLVHCLRSLTALNRSVVAPVDWTAASGG